jgi:hypothetical protein
MQITIMAIPLYIANRSLTFRDFSKNDEKKLEQYPNIKQPSTEVYKEAKYLLET